MPYTLTITAERPASQQDWAHALAELAAQIGTASMNSVDYRVLRSPAGEVIGTAILEDPSHA